VRRRAIAAALVAIAVVAVPTGPLWAFSAPHPPQPKQLTVSGFVIGRIAKGNKIRLGILAFDPRTFTDLQSVAVALILHGQVLERVTFFVREQQLQLGDQPRIDISKTASLTSGFFRMNPRTVRLIRGTFAIRVTMWAVVRETVPKATTVRVVATGEGGQVTYAKEKVGIYGGFLTWGTFAIGFLLALLIGAFLANLRWSRRYRALRPSIWDVLERRLREERVRPGLLAGVGADGGSP